MAAIHSFALLFQILSCSPYPGEFPSVNTTHLTFLASVYVIDEHIASGSSTRVFRASKISSERPSMPERIAVKCIRSDSLHLLSKFEREFRALQELQKKPTPKFPEGFYLSPQWPCGTKASCRFGAMTLSGPDLDRVVSKDMLGLDKARLGRKVGNFELFVATVGLDLINKLEIIHDIGIVHDDIGPRNVALPVSFEPHVFLIDFGQAKLSEDITPGKFQFSLERDYRRTKHLLLRLLKTDLRSQNQDLSEQELRKNKLFLTLANIEDDSKQLKAELDSFLLAEYEIKYPDKVIW